MKRLVRVSPFDVLRPRASVRTIYRKRDIFVSMAGYKQINESSHGRHEKMLAFVPIIERIIVKTIYEKNDTMWGAGVWRGEYTRSTQSCQTARLLKKERRQSVVYRHKRLPPASPHQLHKNTVVRRNIVHCIRATNRRRRPCSIDPFLLFLLDPR